MRLRARLLWTVLLVAAPQVLGIVWWDLQSRRDAAAIVLGRMLEQELAQPDSRARCEADPRGWSGERPPPGQPPDKEFPPPERSPRPGAPPEDSAVGRPPTFHACSAQGVCEGIPPLSADLLATVAPGGLQVAPMGSDPGEVAVWQRTGWEPGPCAVVVLGGSTVRGFLGAVLPRTEVWLLPLVLTTLTVGLALGPVAARLRRLEAAVRAGAARGYLELEEDRGGDEIGALSQAFVAAGATIRAEMQAREAREQALREFVANTSHDLLVPLTVLQGHLSAKRIHEAMAETQYIGALVQNLVAQARMDGTAVRREPVELGAMVGRVVARHRTIAGTREIRIESGVPEEPVWVEGDETLLEQALNNLVHNAVRYARVGGNVAVVLDIEGEAFRLAVIDDGPGMDPALLGRLTERGFRDVEARSRAPEGLGIGLHIAARVAQVHAIELNFVSEPEKGTEATLTGARRSPPAGEGCGGPGSPP
ncbi:MAG TPA: HAMP domain-containing sensor histidine kinase [Myxococcota bacterium]|nr:HAMP domain-containing sensor histidine kinase [Myxococcota bacterium]